MSVVLAALALLPRAARGQVPDRQLLHATAPCGPCAIGAQRAGHDVVITMVLTDPRGFDLGFAGHRSLLHVVSIGHRRWRASTGVNSDIGTVRFSIDQQGHHVVISLPAALARDGVAVSDAAGRIPGVGFLRPRPSPKVHWQLLDVLVLTAVLAAAFYWWRRRTHRSAPMLIATAAAFTLLYVSEPVWGHFLRTAIHSGRLIDAALVALTVAVIGALSWIVCRLLAPPVIRWVARRPNLERHGGVLGILAVLAIVAMYVALLRGLLLVASHTDVLSTSWTTYHLARAFEILFPPISV
jgi:hypothetical protein